MFLNQGCQKKWVIQNLTLSAFVIGVGIYLQSRLIKWRNLQTKEEGSGTNSSSNIKCYARNIFILEENCTEILNVTETNIVL